MATYTQALSEARRVARLKGRPLSQQEVAGVTAGYADTASERAARAKQLDIQAQQTAEAARANRARERLAAQELAEEARMNREKINEAVKQRKMTMAGTGAVVGGAVGGGIATGSVMGGMGGLMGGASSMSWAGPIGMVVGGVIGYALGGSHFCGAIKSRLPDMVTNADMSRMYKLRRWIADAYPMWVLFYDEAAPIALENMYHRLGSGGFDMMLDELHSRLFAKIPVLIRIGDMPGAMREYKRIILPIILEYAPAFIPAASMAIEAEEAING